MIRRAGNQYTVSAHETVPIHLGRWTAQQTPFRIIKAPEHGDLYSVNASTVPATKTLLAVNATTTLPLMYAASSASYKSLRTDGFAYVAVDRVTGNPTSCQKSVAISIVHVNSLPTVAPIYKNVSDLYAALPYVNITLVGSDKDETQLQYAVSSLSLSGVLREPNGLVIDQPGTDLTGRTLRFYPEDLTAKAGTLASFTYQASDGFGWSHPAVVDIVADGDAMDPLHPVGGAGYAMRLNGSSSLTFGLWRDWESLHTQVCLLSS
jgi:hypothetical protein